MLHCSTIFNDMAKLVRFIYFCPQLLLSKIAFTEKTRGERLSYYVFFLCMPTIKIQMQISWVGRSTSGWQVEVEGRPRNICLRPPLFSSPHYNIVQFIAIQWMKYITIYSNICNICQPPLFCCNMLFHVTHCNSLQNITLKCNTCLRPPLFCTRPACTTFTITAM